MNAKCIAIFALSVLLGIHAQAQELTTFNGISGKMFYQDDKEITASEMESLMKSNPEVYQEWLEHKKLWKLTLGSLTVQMGFIAWSVSLALVDGFDTKGGLKVPLIGSLVFTGVTSALAISSETKKKNAILGYNKGLDELSTLYFGPTQNGLGFVYGF